MKRIAFALLVSAGCAGGNMGPAGMNAAGGVSGGAGTTGTAGTGGNSGTAGGSGAAGNGGKSAGGGGTGETGGGSAGAGAGGDARVDAGLGGGAGADGGPGADAGAMTAAGVRWVGRVDNSDAAGPRFSWSGSGFVATFSGTSLDVKLKNSDAFVFQPVIDDQPGAQFAAAKGEASRTLATGLTAGVHTVALYRQTEGGYGTSQLLGVTVGGGTLRAAKPASGRFIEIVGDSISCGYGDRGTSATCSFTYDTESHWDSYGAVAARQLNAEVSTIAFSGRGMYRNLDGSMTETLPLLYDRVLTGSSTPTWGFSVEPQAVVINLGTNDFGPGDPGTGFTAAYTKFVGAVRGHYPKALIVCALGSMVSDGYPAGEMRLTLWRSYLNAVIAARHTAGDDKVVLLEFSAQTSDQYGCDYHPNVAKQQLMGDALATLLKTRLGW